MTLEDVVLSEYWKSTADDQKSQASENESNDNEDNEEHLRQYP